MPTTLLWPPLEDIRRALGVAVSTRPEDDVATGSSPAPGFLLDVGTLDLPEPLRRLAEARVALASLSGAGPWCQGDIVGVQGPGGRLLGVLLDEVQQQGGAAGERWWRGWMTSAEMDWSGEHDLLLEPGDEPYDPIVSVVQTWNRLTLRETRTTLLGRLGAVRLAAVRALQDEQVRRPAQSSGGIAPRPGFIGLRDVGGFSVLTGTPLAVDDPRQAYQDAYAEAASLLTCKSAATASVDRSETGLASWLARRLTHWFAIRPGRRLALAGTAAFATVLVAQVWYLSSPTALSPDDEIRFRTLPEAMTTSGLSVQWRSDADADAIAALLQSFGGEMVSGPDAAGRWQVRALDLAAAQRALLASPLVVEVVSP